MTKLSLVLVGLLLAAMISEVRGDELCPVSTDGNLCLFGGKKVLTESAHIESNVLLLNFDSEVIIDTSGYGQNILNQIENYAPGLYGIGASGKFDKDTYLEIEDSSEFDEQTYTISFWIFYNGGVETDEEGYMFCPIVLKGQDDYENEEYERAPGIFVERETGNLVVYWETDDTDTYPMGEYLVSSAVLGIRRWTHVAFVRERTGVNLYINGALDVSEATITSSISNSHNLKIGTPDSYSTKCNIEFFIDNFKFFNSALGRTAIHADASPSNGGLSGSEVALGCTDCSQGDAADACTTSNYHLCNSFETNSFAFSFAKSLGWVELDSIVWTDNDNADLEDFEDEEDSSRYENTVGLCCKSH